MGGGVRTVDEIAFYSPDPETVLTLLASLVFIIAF